MGVPITFLKRNHISIHGFDIGAYLCHSGEFSKSEIIAHYAQLPVAGETRRTEENSYCNCYKAEFFIHNLIFSIVIL